LSNFSEKYDSFYEAPLVKQPLEDIRLNGWPRDRYEAIVAAGGTGESIMDVGCGNGFLLYQFRNSFRQLIGVEFSKARLRQAHINLEGLSFSPILGSSEDMSSVDTESIDQIISADTIEHVPDVYRAAEEMFRVLRAGGTLVINTPNVAFAKKRLLLMMGRFPSTSQSNEGLGSDILFDGGHLHYFTFRSLGLLLERVGFEIVRRTGFGVMGRIHDFYPALLSGGVQLVARKPAPFVSPVRP
jgi:SAM-dependent methyltransferase